MTRIFGVSRNTIMAWLKRVHQLPPLKKTLVKKTLVKKTLVKAKKRDVLELDEMWSFVRCKDNQRWVWLAQCRRTRQSVTYAIGDRSHQAQAQMYGNYLQPDCCRVRAHPSRGHGQRL